jgi:hypothetical protein
MNTAEYSREDIIAAHPLLDYAQKKGWQFKRSGPNFVCLCPLRDETTPSFTINSEVSLCDAKESGSFENSCSVVLGMWKTSKTDMKCRVLKNTKGLAGNTVQ